MQTFQKNSPWILSILFFLILIWGSIQYITYKRGQWEKDIRNQTLELLIGKKSNLEKSLYSRIYYTRGVAAFVSVKPDITNSEYDRLANEFIQNDTVISSMALSPNAVISAIYPLEGHEAAIGLDLMTHPERREIVELTIKTHKTFVAGPVELVEGGTAFISYTPIFDTTNDDKGIFWGVTDIVILKESLFLEAGLLEKEHDFIFALKGENGTGEKGEVFWGISKVFDQNPVKIKIELPYGNWVLAAVPSHGWSAYYDQDKVLSSVLLISSLIISILLFFILHGMHKIQSNEREFKAIFRSMDSLIIEFNKDGEYFKIPPTNISLLVLPIEDVLGKKIDELFEPKLAKKMMDAIDECLEKREVLVLDYPLRIKDEEKWFRARVSHKSGSSVIFNINDITKEKKAERDLLKSEKRLKKMNEVKDLFFSVIAHDLRNPIGSIYNLTGLILDKNEERTEQEKELYIRSIHDTTLGLNNLLENLFSWSKSQQKSIVAVPEQLSVFDACNAIIDSQITHALFKNITIENEVEQNQLAFFDKELTRVIIRNLLSNSIKYSNENSTIVISSSNDDSNGSVLIHVTDSGLGIKESRLENLFDIGEKELTKGTKNEKGSGMGLVLCKEFAELQSGKITVKSELGKGSTFTLKLPQVPVI